MYSTDEWKNVVYGLTDISKTLDLKGVFST